jgi:hypothetical protein
MTIFTLTVSFLLGFIVGAVCMAYVWWRTMRKR